MRPLTAVETAAGIAIGGSVLAVAVPTFIDNLHASRLVEPVEGLRTIAARATALAAARAAEVAYPSSVPLTPEQVPRGEPVADPPGTWDHPTWRTLAFEQIAPHSFSFSFDSENAPGHSAFLARAQGDLDGDGVFSTFRVAGESRDGAEPISFPLESDREIE